MFVPTMQRNVDAKSLTYSVTDITITTELDATKHTVVPTPMDLPLSEILLLDPLRAPLKALPETLGEVATHLSARCSHSTPLVVLSRTLTDHLMSQPDDKFAQAALTVLATRAQTMIIGENFSYLVANPAHEIAQMIPTLALDVKCVTLNKDTTSKPLYTDADPLNRPADMPPLQVRADAISDHWPLDKTASAQLAADFKLLAQSSTPRPASAFRSVLQLGPSCHVVTGTSADTIGAMKTAWQSPALHRSKLN